MKIATKALLTGFLALLVSALVPQPPARAGDDAVSNGTRLLEQVAEAYKSAPAFTDKMRVEQKGVRGNFSALMTIALGSGTDARMLVDGYVFTAVGDRFYMYREDLPNKYLERPLAGNFVKSFRTLTSTSPPAPQPALRSGERMEDYLSAFGMTRAGSLKLVGHQLTDREGRPVHELEFAASRGDTVRAFIDPETKFINAIEIVGRAGIFTASMEPKRHDRLPEPIVFDTTDRRQVQGIAELGLGKGDRAPDFTLETLEGELVSLDDHRGCVVVLDFWATWCGPCRFSLTKLQEFATWAEANDVAVEVFAVDVGERVRTPEQKRELVSRYWERLAFTIPTLMDFDGSVSQAFEVGPIPHTVVVGPDGTIIEVEVGMNPYVDVVDHLKRLVTTTLQASR